MDVVNATTYLILDTKEVEIGTMLYKGRKIRLIDTPGFDDSHSDRDDAFILKEIASWLVIAYSQEPRLLLSGIIYLHPINNVRMRGSDKSNLRMFKAMCGDKSLSCVVLATTMWANIDEKEGLERQKSLKKEYWKSMIEAGSVDWRHDNTRESALRIIDHIISRQQNMTLGIQHQLVDECRSVADTDAGRELRSKVISERDRATRNLRAAEKDLQDAFEQNNSKVANQLIQEQEKYEAQIKAKEAEIKSMQVDADELSRKKLEELARADLERETRHKKSEMKIAELKQELEKTQKHQKELETSLNPPNYDVALLASRNEMLQMELKRQEQQQQIAQFQEQKQLQIQQYHDGQQFQISQMKLQDLVAAQRHHQQLRTAKRGVIWGSVGAVAGVAAVTSCTVM